MACCVCANAESFPFQKVSFQFHERDTQGLGGREGQQGQESPAEPIVERAFQILSLTPKSERERLDVNPNTDRIGKWTVQYSECLLEKPAEHECPERPPLHRWDLHLGTEAAHQFGTRESICVLYSSV